MNTSVCLEVALIPTAQLDSSMEELSIMSTHLKEELMDTSTGNPNAHTCAELRRLNTYHSLRAADLIEALLTENKIIKDQVTELRPYKDNGWRACIDHIIKPQDPCPICTMEKVMILIGEAKAELRKV